MHHEVVALGVVFAASLAIYGLTLVWMFRYLPDWPRTRYVAGWITAAVALIEVGLIALQAGREAHRAPAVPVSSPPTTARRGSRRSAGGS